MKNQHPKKKIIQSKEDLYVMCQQIKELEKIRNYRKINIILNDLIQKYPNDKLVQYYYSKFLRRNNEYSKSLEILEKLDDSQTSIQIEKVFCCIELGHWHRIIELCESLLEKEMERDSTKVFLERARIYAYKQLKKMPKMNREFTYIEKQICDYSNMRALYYIMGADEFSDISELKILLEKLKNVLHECKYTPMPSIMLDKYMFENLDGKILKVETIHNTEDIVHLTFINQLFGCKDRILNSHLLYNEEMSERNTSQTEKFYQKYKNMI